MSSWANMIKISLDSFVQQKVSSPAYLCTHPVCLFVCCLFIISRVCPPMFITKMLRYLWSNLLLFGIFRLNYAYIASCHGHDNQAFITFNRDFMGYIIHWDYSLEERIQSHTVQWEHCHIWTNTALSNLNSNHNLAIKFTYNFGIVT